MIPKGKEMIPVKLSSLKKLTDDLVKLEDINDPFIVHNLRERCKTGDIYVNILYTIINDKIYINFFYVKQKRLMSVIF